MNSAGARRLLWAHRSGVYNDSEEMAEALVRTGIDRDLTTWYEDQRRFHDEVRHALRTIEVPTELKERILAKLRTSVAEGLSGKIGNQLPVLGIARFARG